MSDSRRKLLPYEHQLVEALGVSKEEYLNFVEKQQIYSDPKSQTILDVTNDFGLVALILTVIGVLFQVAAALLAPKPEIPKVSGGQAATRDEVFAPRFGFNNAQQLAAYGDPVNLIYTNNATNPNGGVRVATSLIWSAVQSYGNSQLIQLLLLIGAGGIGSIDLGRSAFGQLPLRDLIAQNYWTYFRANYTGPLQNSFVSSASPADPTAFGNSGENPYRIRTGSTGAKAEGFSHAYSPTSSNTFGAYGAVPINVNLSIRDDKGAFQNASNQITSTGWSQALSILGAGTIVTVTLAQFSQTVDKNLAVNEANESRRTISGVFDSSSVFKLGSAKFKLINLNRGDIVDGPMVATLQCIEAGRAPSVSYGVQDPRQVNLAEVISQRAEYDRTVAAADALLEEDQRIQSDLPVKQRLPETRTGTGNARARALALPLTPEQLVTNGAIFTVTYTKPRNPRAKSVRTVKKKRNLTTAEKDLLRQYSETAPDTNSTVQKDDVFLHKALMRAEEASYETISPCGIIDFSIRARVFKRVSGRQSEYGSKRIKGWPVSDNGIKARSAMFIVKYKRTTEADYHYLPGIFVVSRAADIENYLFLRFNSNLLTAASASNWSFKFEPVVDPVAEFQRNDLLYNGQRYFHYLENSGNLVQFAAENGAVFEYNGAARISSTALPPINNNPGAMNEWDTFAVSSDSQTQFSFDNGPEFSIAAVTEQIVDSFSNYNQLYQDVSLFGINMFSGRTVQDLRSLSLFVNQGRLCRALRSDLPPGLNQNSYLSESSIYANNAPDIFLDTVLDANDGIGQYATLHSVDLEQLAISKKFCERNSFFMDGIIAEPSSWREFWASTAGFSLLELAKVGGQDTLVPALPYNRNTGEITTSLSIVALFNQGNILEDSYKEEFIDYGSNTKDAIVTAVYRTSEANSAFAKNISVDVRLSDTIEANATRETVDLSGFVTRREQAIAVAKFLCQTKRHSQKAIEFKTFPTDSPVFPGAYIYVELAQNQWNNIYTGIVEEGGSLNVPAEINIPNGSYSALCYVPNNGGVQSFPSVNVSGNVAPALTGSIGQLFVLGTAIRSKRVFRVTEVIMDEEGEVTVRGVQHATDDSGNSLIARGVASRVPGLFTIDGRPE